VENFSSSDFPPVFLMNCGLSPHLLPSYCKPMQLTIVPGVVENRRVRVKVGRGSYYIKWIFTSYFQDKRGIHFRNF